MNGPALFVLIYWTTRASGSSGGTRAEGFWAGFGRMPYEKRLDKRSLRPEELADVCVRANPAAGNGTWAPARGRSQSWWSSSV